MGELRINGERVDPKRQYIVNKGDTILICTPGGGGYGPSGERTPQANAHDRSLGYTDG